MLNKEECEKALIRFARPYLARVDTQNLYYECNGKEYSINNDMYLLGQLINEHFDNPPLKLEELKHDMWVWDNKEKWYFKIVNPTDYDLPKAKENQIFFANYGYTTFKENRFYLREVEEDE